eukprot:Blabericola_migrator_1__12229@NODE_760_length_6627_cov_45_648933_g83_i2_p3_GENE_NODE_760_length_6627_cov_45_648933_g83_i2NODE_760_length_6627_cov_45_648933_g83_i2_p3_ORF_typecomplete_len192_score36_23_NODE_760_length_6627_cov_45_648933_g83_i249345509
MQKGDDICSIENVDAPTTYITQHTKPTSAKTCSIQVVVSRGEDKKTASEDVTALHTTPLEAGKSADKLSLIIDKEATAMRQGQATWLGASDLMGTAAENLKFKWKLLEGKKVCSLSKNTKTRQVYLIQTENPKKVGRGYVCKTNLCLCRTQTVLCKLKPPMTSRPQPPTPLSWPSHGRFKPRTHFLGDPYK